MIECSYRSRDNAPIALGKMVGNKRKNRKLNHVFFSRVTVLSFHPIYIYIYIYIYMKNLFTENKTALWEKKRKKRASCVQLRTIYYINKKKLLLSLEEKNKLLKLIATLATSQKN